MREKTTLPVMLVAVTGLTSLVLVLLRAFRPGRILPKWDLVTMAALSLTALVLEGWMERGVPRRDWLLTALTGGLAFGLLPFAAGLTPAGTGATLAVLGAVEFTVLTALFTSLRERLATGKVGGLAPAAAAFTLFLACQAFSGLLTM